MGDFFALRAKKSWHHGHGKPLPPLLRFVCRAGCPHPAAGRRGRRPLQWQTANFPAMADARGGLWAGRPTRSPAKRSSLPGLLQPCRGRACPARGLTESARLREATPGGYGIRPYGKCCRPFCGLYVGRGAITPPRGVGDAAPYSGKPRTFPLWQTSAAACGQAALRDLPQKGHPSRDYCNPVGAGHARPAA